MKREIPLSLQPQKIREIEELPLTLYVGNIPSTLSRQEIQNIFSRYGAINRIIIPKARGPQGSNYAFVHYQNPESVSLAIKNMKGITIGGRVLELSTVQKTFDYGTRAPRASEGAITGGFSLYIGGINPARFYDPRQLEEAVTRYTNIAPIRTTLNEKGGRSFSFMEFATKDELVNTFEILSKDRHQNRDNPLAGQSVKISFNKNTLLEYPELKKYVRSRTKKKKVKQESLPQEEIRKVGKELDEALGTKDKSPRTNKALSPLEILLSITPKPITWNREPFIRGITSLVVSNPKFTSEKKVENLVRNLKFSKIEKVKESSYRIEFKNEFNANEAYFKLKNTVYKGSEIQITT